MDVLNPERVSDYVLQPVLAALFVPTCTSAPMAAPRVLELLFSRAPTTPATPSSSSTDMTGKVARLRFARIALPAAAAAAAQALVDAEATAEALEAALAETSVVEASAAAVEVSASAAVAASAAVQADRVATLKLPSRDQPPPIPSPTTRPLVPIGARSSTFET